MEYIPFSPFQRPMTHAHLHAIAQREATQPTRPINKWALFRELSKAQAAFGLSERDLTVLQGLLSFHRDDMLGGNAEMVVFPSNKALSERLNGMACSTMRRYLARLVSAGFLTRRDSPNGKRFCRKDGDDRVAFGFDLAPLPRRATEITQAAEEVRAAEQRLRRLREIVSLMRRDLAAVADYGRTVRSDLTIWDQFSDQARLGARMLRRKLVIADLEVLKNELETALDMARDLIDGLETEDLSTSDAGSEQHHQSSNKDSIDFEPANAPAPQTDDETNTDVIEPAEEETERPLPRIPLHLVVTACPAIRDFYGTDIRHWHQLYEAACHVRPSMGITPSAWEEAQKKMGPEQAAIVVLAILERFSEIRSPGGYLRALTAKAADGAFSCGPMIMALMNARSAT